MIGRRRGGTAGPDAAPLYPFLALAALAMSNQLRPAAVLVLAPEINDALGVGKTALAAITALKLLAVTLAALPFAAAVQHRPRRAALSIVGALVWSVATGATAVVANGWQLALVAVVHGAAGASASALHTPLAADLYAPGLRVRVLSAYDAATHVARVAGPLLVGLLAGVLDLGWRQVFVVVGLTALVLSLSSLRLRDPGYGSDRAAHAQRVQLHFGEAVRAVWSVPTVRTVLWAQAAAGAMFVPLATYLLFFLRDVWGLGPGERSVFYGFTPVAAVAALAWYAPRAERLRQRDPALLIRTSAAIGAVAVVVLAATVFAPWFAVMAVGVTVAGALFAVLSPTLQFVVFAVVPSPLRPHVAALGGIFVSTVGGMGGLIVLGGVEERFGAAAAIAALAIPGLAAIAIFLTTLRTIDDDMARLRREAEEASTATSGARLSCRGVRVSYGGHDVLRDVDVDVAPGERVAVLGPNGVGKTTLLHVLSGVVPPDAGVVRLDGVDITFVDPARRLRLGIATLTGIPPVFGSLTVEENLLLAARAVAPAGTAQHLVRETTAVFPFLATRGHEPAAHLSGGQQRLLALARVFLTRPRVLLIDELTAGLAPSATVDLIAKLRATLSPDTSMVFVEQSPQVALEVAHRVIVLQSGRVVFCGSPLEMRQRPDLLQPVFLRS